jgi:ribosomal protein S27E
MTFGKISQSLKSKHLKGDVMTIAARCQDCEKLYKVDAKLAGKRVRCKACGGVVAVPIESAEAPQRASAPTATSRKPAARPAPRAEPEEPFGNIDALMSLESSGTVEDNPALVFNPTKPRRTPVEPSGADNVLIGKFASGLCAPKLAQCVHFASA